MITRKTVGMRLREARDALGWTQEEAATRLRIPRSRLALIELGQRPIDSTLLWRFADLYGQRLMDFLSEERQRSPLALLRGQTLPAEAKVELQRLHARAREQSVLELRLRLKPPLIPSYELGVGQSAADQGEALAAQERNRLGLGEAPVGDVFDLLEHHGVKIFPLPCDQSVDGGFFYTKEVGPCVFLSVPRQGHAAPAETEGANSASSGHAPPLQWRFTALHEYCHTLVDRGLGAAVCHTEASRRLPELRANAFAAALLMPRRGFERVAEEPGHRRSRPTVYDVIRLMWHFRVSFRAVLYRLKSLGLGQEALTVLGKAEGAVPPLMRKLGYAPALADQPFRAWAAGGHRRRLGMLAVEAYRRDLISLGKAAELLDLPLDEVADVLAALGVEVRRSTV